MGTAQRVIDGSYRPTPEDMQKEVSIDASPEEAARALFAGDPPVVKSGKGEKSRRLWERWLKRGK